MHKQDHNAKRQKQADFDKKSKSFYKDCFENGVEGLNRLFGYAQQSGKGARQFSPGKHSKGSLTAYGHRRRKYAQLREEGLPKILAEWRAGSVFGHGKNKRQTVLFNPEIRKRRSQRNQKLVEIYNQKARESRGVPEEIF